MSFTVILAAAALAVGLGEGAAQPTTASNARIVTVDNFTRAETDTYFARFVARGSFGRLDHGRQLADVANQTVVRTNRDTLYSQGVFDLDAGPVTVTLPDAGGRFMSLMSINQDHYNPVATAYTSGAHTYTREQVGTRYLALLIRIFVNPADPADLAAVHALQDRVEVRQAGQGRFEVPDWDQASLTRIRNALKELGGLAANDMFGTRETVNPVHHLIATAAGWGGNPAVDAKYLSVVPARNDGTIVHRLTVRDVPVDAFWSISVYNAEGFFAPNAQNAYSLNNLTAARDANGSWTMQFGGCDGQVRNCLPITPGWNYTVRMYLPRPEILDGRWTFPEARPVN